MNPDFSFLRTPQFCQTPKDKEVVLKVSLPGRGWW